MNEDNEEKNTPISKLADNYTLDLETLQMMDIADITKEDMIRLEIICNKHGIAENITKSNFIKMIGKVSFIINSKLESYIKRDILRTIEESDVKDMPRVTVQSKSKKPAW